MKSWCLGRAAACDCGTPWTFLLPFLYKRYGAVIFFDRSYTEYFKSKALSLFIIASFQGKYILKRGMDPLAARNI